MIETMNKLQVKKFISVSDMLISSDPSVVIVTCGLGSCLGVAAYDPVLVVARAGESVELLTTAEPIAPAFEPVRLL